MTQDVLIFDMDGTLYHTDDFVDLYVELLTDNHNIRTEMKNDYQTIMDDFSSEDQVDFSRDNMSLGDVWQIIRFISGKQGLSEEYQFDVFLKIRETMIDEEMIEVDYNLIDTIKKLKNPTILMTNSPKESATPFIEYLDLDNVFDHHIFDAKKPSKMKSHIEGIKEIYPGHDIYKIGDNLTNDIKSSNKLGLKTIYINHYNNNALNEITVFNLKELNCYLYKNFLEV